MSSYRPKSLDELNSRYAQAKSAQAAIKKGVSGISDVPADEIDIDLLKDGEVAEQAREISSREPVKDISTQVSDFIKSVYGEQPKKPAVPPAQPYAAPKAASAAKQPAREDEQGSLLDEYLRVMNDEYEDEGDGEREQKKRKLPKLRSSRQRSQQPAATAAEPPAQPEQPTSQEASFEPIGEPIGESELSDIGASPDIPFFVPELDFDVDKLADAESDSRSGRQSADSADAGDTDNTGDTGELGGEQYGYAPYEAYEADEAEPHPEEPRGKRNKSKKAAKKKGKRSAAHILRSLVLGIMLAAGLAATVLTVAADALLKLNTAEKSEIFGRYFVTAQQTVGDGQIQAGDLVLCRDDIFTANGKFILCVNEDNSTFVIMQKLDTFTNAAGNRYYMVDGGRSVPAEQVLATVERSFGKVGYVLDFITHNLIAVVIALAVYDLLMLLLLIRGRRTGKGGKKSAKGKGKSRKKAGRAEKVPQEQSVAADSPDDGEAFSFSDID